MKKKKKVVSKERVRHLSRSTVIVLTREETEALQSLLLVILDPIRLTVPQRDLAFGLAKQLERFD